jgi:hypothetical protein
MRLASVVLACSLILAPSCYLLVPPAVGGAIGTGVGAGTHTTNRARPAVVGIVIGLVVDYIVLDELIRSFRSYGDGE